jgi:predicted ABC-type ATPase
VSGPSHSDFLSDNMPDLYIIAGPNGAGKTTTAEKLLPDYLGCTEFVNADNIARGISPFKPESVAFQAGRVMLERMRELVEKQESFAFETTLSAKSYVAFLKHCTARGYTITLVFFWLDSPHIAKQRVKNRVEKGGHNIPARIIERRYYKGIENFGKYFVNLCDRWMVWNNSGRSPELAAYADEDGKIIIDVQIMKKLMP